MHSITSSNKQLEIRNNTYEVLAAYLASGINPNETILFNQSSISGHSELSWILSCRTPIGWLNRMTQFKDKAGKNKEKASLGLYSYPVLMAADILLYKANYVPVGDDQKQHLELCRNISQSFNRFYEIDFFPLPEPIISENTSRIMSLKDGLKKMSKSDQSDMTRINLMDSNDDIDKKIRKAKTDSLPFPLKIEEITDRPEIKNLVGIFSSLSEMSFQSIIKNYQEKNLSVFKKDLSEILVEKISKISLEMKRLLKDKDYLNSVLENGKEKAFEISSLNLRNIKKIMGLF